MPHAYMHVYIHTHAFIDLTWRSLGNVSNEINRLKLLFASRDGFFAKIVLADAPIRSSSMQ